MDSFAPRNTGSTNLLQPDHSTDWTLWASQWDAEVEGLKEQLREQGDLLRQEKVLLELTWWDKLAQGFHQFLMNAENHLGISISHHLLLIAVLIAIMAICCSPCLVRRSCKCLKTSLCGLCGLCIRKPYVAPPDEELQVLRRT